MAAISLWSPAISDAILSGTFTVESTFNIAANPASSTYPALFAFGTGTGTAPRTLIFDFRVNSGKYGAIQYNASSWANSACLNTSGLDFTQPSTCSIVGGNSATANASFCQSGASVKSIPNNKKYMAGSGIDATLHLRGYDNTTQVETTINSFRVYSRSLSAEELLLNNTIDDVRFRGADRDPKRRLYITDDDLSLRVQYHTGHTLIMLR